MARIAAVDVVLVGEVGNISAADGGSILVGTADDDSSASVIGGGIGSGI